jgi:FMN phosphatase YigB (HAD superfamily)
MEEIMIVTFDFDNTLTVTQFDLSDWWFTKDAGPNFVMLQCMIDHLENGNDVHIVTSRRDSHASRDEVNQFLIRHGVHHKLAGIHFTNGNLKADKLFELDASQHHDDDEEEIAALHEGCEGILVTNGFLDAFGKVCDPMEERFKFPE